MQLRLFLTFVMCLAITGAVMVDVPMSDAGVQVAWQRPFHV